MKTNSNKIKASLFSIAPMMAWTDRHCRYFHRLLTRRALLYTEMVTTGAVLYGDRARLLRFDPTEHPVAVQLGGSDPAALAAAACICADLGYDEINLNAGCPSDRVQSGRFGACLMAEPLLVGDCIAAMKAAVGVPVTVKCRIGIDDQDPEAALDALADAVVAASVDRLVVHARKAWLRGLSPRENRNVPPLDYARVHRLKARLPALDIVINGGIASLEEAGAHLERLDGVMMGRAAYQEPWRLFAVDSALFGAPAPWPSLHAAAEAMIPYVEREVAGGVRASSILRHMVGLFHHVPGARAFRRHLATWSAKPSAGAEVLRDALGFVTPSPSPALQAEKDNARAAEAARRDLSNSGDLSSSMGHHSHATGVPPPPLAGEGRGGGLATHSQSAAGPLP
jgi:tRNA-dihydrouridine synthase A